MARIFLSYSRTDADAAKVIADTLSHRGHTVWWDKHIRGGSKFAVEIEQALAAAEVVIVLWSRDAARSAWVLDEAAEARDSGRLLPITLDDSKPPLGFRQFQSILGEGRLEAAMEEVFEALAQRGQHGDDRQHGAEQSHPAAGNISLHCSTARRLEEQGRFDAAWRELEAALAIDVDSLEANRQAAWHLYARGRPAEAITFYEKAAGCSKTDHRSAAMLISCFHATQDPGEVNRAAALAVARAEQSIAVASSSGAPFASGARGLAALGHHERARKWVRKALNLEPGNLEMRYHLASTVARFLEDGDAAMDVLEPFVEAARNPLQVQLLETDPNWSSIRETKRFQTLLGHARKRVAAEERPASA